MTLMGSNNDEARVEESFMQLGIWVLMCRYKKGDFYVCSQFVTLVGTWCAEDLSLIEIYESTSSLWR